ncbi:MAG: regulatory iron-sulfur-containing complex subunit RicT, partial [Bacteroidia bacterium]|nr:regulatory iron-sulfur-containing complex subunit RicT [Bacteroidia bacterium]
LGGEFKLRVEMKQVGYRQEAGILGGVGSCGRELCCSSWLTEFKSVTTAAARYQNISVNPAKIAGQCGKLKCCLNYELDVYIEALRDIPDVREIKTETGIAYLQKTDIFEKKMWFSYGGDSDWIMLDVSRVVEYQKMNQEGILPPGLSIIQETTEDLTADFVDVVGQSNLHQQEPSSRKSRRSKSRRSGNKKGKTASLSDD